jgi:uncharacterized protein (DUF1800 family)/fibronectin type 3 domain-containing protein
VTLTERWLYVALVSLLMPMALPAEARAGAAPPPPSVAPLNLTAVTGERLALLSWSPVVGAKGYRVFRATGDVWTQVAVVVVPGVRNNGLTNGTTYLYRVAAYNDGGLGPYSNIARSTPLAPPAGLTAIPGDRQVTLSWQASLGAATYSLFRVLANGTSTEVASNIKALRFVDTGLTNGTLYYYRVRASAQYGASGFSVSVSTRPVPAPPPAPGHLVATAGNGNVLLKWDAVAGAAGYSVFRTATGVWDATPLARPTAPTFSDTTVINGTTYSYRVAARNAGGDGPFSATVTAKPVPPPPSAPGGVTATAGADRITVAWSVVAGATSYNVYRGTAAGAQAAMPVATGLAAPPFVDSGIAPGSTYFYKVTALNAGGESARSAEASAIVRGPLPEPDAATQAAFRLLRQATWGPRPGDVDHVKQVGAAAFLTEQFAAPISQYPDTLREESVELTQEYFMHLALTAPDQLRQRVAWALHKIWVVSAVEVPESRAILTYYRILMNGAFGNYRSLMRAVTLNPAMGRYLNMLNNRSQQITGVPPNENYPRELMQLFTIGIPRLNPNGTPVLDALGNPVPAYTETDVRELARILTGWTFAGAPGVRANWHSENFEAPMEPVERDHDNGAKVFLGRPFTAGQTATQDLDQALDILFNHPNVGPFVSRQLIQQLVTSNPTPGYVAAIAAVFNNNGQGVRGDLAAVIRAILMHPEASTVAATSGKLAEPALYIVSMLRALNATVKDTPFMSNKSEEMGQKVFFPPSVFSYFSPGFRVRGTAAAGGQPLTGPEFQILTSVTALVRANFAAELLANRFGDNVTYDLNPFRALAPDPAVLVNYVNLLFVGGRLSTAERAEIVKAVMATPPERPGERSRTAIYLTLVIAQSQIDR